MSDILRRVPAPPRVPSVVLLLMWLLPAAASGQEKAEEPAETVKVKVEIEGLEGELADNAEAVLGLKLQEGNELSPARARALHRRAPEELQLALAPFGRYDVKVQGDLVSETSDWTARYVVDPGEPTRIERVDVVVTGEGAADSGFVAILDSLPFTPGDTLRHAPYETIKAELHRQALNHGYFDAAFDTAQIRVDRPRHAAEIVLHFDTGPRYRFGPITVEQDVLDPRYVDGYVTARQGEPFDAALLRETQIDLTSGPWFGRADIELDTGAAGDNLEVPVQFELTPARPQRYEIALGYGTDTGFRGTLGAKFRRINRNAHNADVELRVSQIETGIAGRYNIPRPFPSTSVYSLFGSYGDVSPTWSSTRVGRVGASWAHMRGPFRETISLAWEQSSYETAVDTGKATLIGPEIDWTWVETNDRIVATKGHRLNLKLSGALDGVLSTATFLNANLDAKLIRSVGRRVRAIARGQVGYIVTDDIIDLPPTRRYVTGGDQSVRGYAFESLGPALPGETEDGEPLLVGGKALIVGSAQADYEVIPRWRLAVFGDAGNALADFSEIELEFGVGAGISWVSPIGMIRLDGAFAVSEPGSPFRIHFIIGPDL